MNYTLHQRVVAGVVALFLISVQFLLALFLIDAIHDMINNPVYEYMRALKATMTVTLLCTVWIPFPVMGMLKVVFHINT